jgi:cobalt-zinc-cadmium efflux system outer membrane protein
MSRFIYILVIGLMTSLMSNAQNLDKYLEIAAQNNPGLKAKYVEFEAALQKVEQVNTLNDPTFSFGYFISPVETRVGAQQMKFSLGQMFPWFGTLDARQDIASQLAESKYQEFLTKQLLLYRNVKNAYYPILELGEHIRIQENNLKLLNTYKELANIQFSNGKGTMVDVLRVDIRMEDLQSKISLLNDKRSPLEATFNLLLNRAADTIVLLDSLPKVVSGYYGEPDSLWVNNPKIAAFELRIGAAKSSENLAILSSRPQIGIGLDYVVVSKRNISSIPDDGKDILMPMATVTLPLYRSKYKAAIKEANLQQEALNLYKKEYENSLLNQYTLAQYKYDESIELIRLYTSEVTKTKRILEILAISYETNGKEYAELLRAQQTLLEYELKLSTQWKEFHITVSQLDFLTNRK